jgi:hypothetical protein
MFNPESVDLLGIAFGAKFIFFAKAVIILDLMLATVQFQRFIHVIGFSPEF